MMMAGAAGLVTRVSLSYVANRHYIALSSDLFILTQWLWGRPLGNNPSLLYTHIQDLTHMLLIAVALQINSP